MDVRELTELKGKTLVSVTVSPGLDEILFKTSDDEVYKMHHEPGCCGDVRVEDIIGDLTDLLHEPLLMAEEVTSNTTPDDAKRQPYDSFTWTFYKFATRKGYVTIRWLGESNGYYSESVSLAKISE